MQWMNFPPDRSIQAAWECYKDRWTGIAEQRAVKPVTMLGAWYIFLVADLIDSQDEENDNWEPACENLELAIEHGLVQERLNRVVQAVQPQVETAPEGADEDDY